MYIGLNLKQKLDLVRLLCDIKEEDTLVKVVATSFGKTKEFIGELVDFSTKTIEIRTSKIITIDLASVEKIETMDNRLSNKLGKFLPCKADISYRHDIDTNKILQAKGVYIFAICNKELIIGDKEHPEFLELRRITKITINNKEVIMWIFRYYCGDVYSNESSARIFKDNTDSETEEKRSFNNDDYSIGFKLEDIQDMDLLNRLVVIEFLGDDDIFTELTGVVTEVNEDTLTLEYFNLNKKIYYPRIRKITRYNKCDRA